MDAEVQAVLDARAPDGSPRWSDEELRAVLPIMCLAIARAFPTAELPPYAEEAVGSMSLAAGVTESDDEPTVLAKISRHIEGLVTGKELLAALERAMGSSLGAGNLDAARASAALLGVSVNKEALSGHRPEGTIPAGPGARFASLAKTPKKP